MKILIISSEVWRDDNNGGNVLSNIFKDSGYEFAQIFCFPGQPMNNLCKNYYQMTDKMMIRNLLKKEKIGKTLKYNEYPSDTSENSVTAEQENKKFYNFFRNHRLEIFYFIRSLIWKFSDWKNCELEAFIKNFNPDIIFAPCYASHELLAIDRYAKQIANVPVISYISDDNYSLHQFRLDPIYWLNRFILRYNMRKTFKIYDLIYTMTDEQKREYENALHCNMKILKKSGDFTAVPEKRAVNSPIRLIYAGGIYCGRWKTLAKIAEQIKIINKETVKMKLDIYTGSNLTSKQQALLNDGRSCRVHSSISQAQLKNEYLNSDIALHVEAFSLRYRLLTRLSFSTKIIDCMSSGCAVMAVCWKKHAGYIYLKNNDIAICVDNYRDISAALNKCLENKDILIEYSKKAKEYGLKNHQANDIRKDFFEDLCSYASPDKE